ncbi:MAG: ankyrin repeat domain-containing protein, partial [Pseudomonadota bacterium]|nr:ankyrin repeat domain-containing protein [Pseudomonadota bacterium]
MQNQIENILSSIESNKKELENRCGFGCIEATIQKLKKANESPESELSLWLTKKAPQDTENSYYQDETSPISFTRDQEGTLQLLIGYEEPEKGANKQFQRVAVINSQKGQRKPSFCGLIQLRDDKRWRDKAAQEGILQKEMESAAGLVMVSSQIRLNQSESLEEDLQGVRDLSQEMIVGMTSNNDVKRETKALNGLINTYKYGSKTVYLVEDRGMPLKIFLETHKKNENYSTQRREIARGFQQAVREMHTQNIVHRDLNPNNILVKVTNDGIKVSIMDFELMDMDNSKNMEPFDFVGTAALPPQEDEDPLVIHPGATFTMGQCQKSRIIDDSYGYLRTLIMILGENDPYTKKVKDQMEKMESEYTEHRGWLRTPGPKHKTRNQYKDQMVQDNTDAIEHLQVTYKDDKELDKMIFPSEDGLYTEDLANAPLIRQIEDSDVVEGFPHWGQLEEILKNGANPNYQNKDGTTPLMLAAEKCSIELVDDLLDAKADPLIQDKKGNTALHHAARVGAARAGTYTMTENHAEIVESLTNRDFKIVELKNNQGQTALHLAAEYNNQQMVQLLVAKGADIFDTDNQGKTALDHAIESNNQEMVKCLVNARDSNEKTALHLAATYRNPQMVQLLLKKGADGLATDNQGQTALHLAARYSNPQMVELLLKKTGIFNRKTGPNLNAKDNQGQTALHLAARYSNPQMVQLLLKKGADRLATDNQRQTALHLAVQSKNTDMVQLLLDNGAQLEATDNQGKTALHLAAQSKSTDMSELLLKKGADIFATDSQGQTALHLAVQSNDTGMVRCLMNARDNDEKTALHLAVQSNNTDMVQLLLNSGAHINAKDRYGRTALDLVGDNKKMRQLLKKQNATSGGVHNLEYRKFEREHDLYKVFDQVASEMQDDENIDKEVTPESIIVNKEGRAHLIPSKHSEGYLFQFSNKSDSMGRSSFSMGKSTQYPKADRALGFVDCMIFGGRDLPLYENTRTDLALARGALLLAYHGEKLPPQESSIQKKLLEYAKEDRQIDKRDSKKTQPNDISNLSKEIRGDNERDNKLKRLKELGFDDINNVKRLIQMTRMVGNAASKENRTSQDILNLYKALKMSGQLKNIKIDLTTPMTPIMDTISTSMLTKQISEGMQTIPLIKDIQIVKKNKSTIEKDNAEKNIKRIMKNALKKGYITQIAIAVINGVKLDKTDLSKAICIAVNKNLPDMVQLLLDKDDKKMTALHHAVSENNQEAIKSLLDNGADLYA